ncbi:MAG TPA: hypothetical protein VN717_11860 [Gemmatimonadaceae bacterium]|jgi:uncharacterized membrane protein HdeD (DUF308 family)|nr:hypothetical protein [Gemmatimonadaceae bacterium]
MRPLGIVGVILIIAGVVVLAMKGVSYTKDRDAVKIAGVELSKEDKGFVPPYVGLIAVVAGVVLVVAGRRKA